LLSVFKKVVARELCSTRSVARNLLYACIDRELLGSKRAALVATARLTGVIDGNNRADT
jgi:hypothetical protein